jgi:hypothetical protein
MPPNSLIENHCVSKTYKKVTCRDLFITVAFKTDEPEKVDFVRIISSTKDGGCPVSFMEGLSDMLTFSIRRIRNIHEARQIVKNMRFHKCLGCPPNKDHSTSCMDAIGMVLEDALKTKEETTT